MAEISKSDFLFDWAKHEDNLLLSRANFFLVSESMLFTAFATIYSAKLEPGYGMWAVIVIGLITSISWKSAYDRSAALQEGIKTKLRDANPVYEKLKEAYSKKSTHAIVANQMPLVFTVTWIVIAGFTFCQK